jgi:hypothetical protein
MHLELAGRWKPAFSVWYSAQPASMNHLIPPGFKLYCRKSRAFCNIFISRMESVRPAGLPVWCGIHGWQINYCIYVVSTAEASGEVKGLYVVRSLIEQKHFSKVSNVMPYFHFRPATIEVSERETEFKIQIDHKENTFELSSIPSNPFRSSSLGTLSDAMNFLQHRNTFVLTSGDFLEFADLHFTKQGKRITGPIGTLQFHSDLDQNELHLEFAAWIQCADFHLVLGRRERPAFLSEYAEIEQ